MPQIPFGEAVRDIVREAALEMGGMFPMDPDRLRVTFKAQDQTPVTIIDLQVGNLIRRRIREAFPGHRINEEETGISGGSSDWVWYVDPLDGTSNVAPQFRLSCVGISVAHRGELVAAAVGDPFEGVITFGEKGSGAFQTALDGSGLRRLSVSQRRTARAKYAEVDALFNLKTVGPKSAFLAELSQFAMNMRMFGSNILAGSHVAQGRVDVALTDAVGGFWDIAPATVLVPEAGGRVMNINGELPKIGDQVVLATNGENHEELLRIFQQCYRGYAGFR